MKKRLEIEWRHLDKDGKTCDRCADTGETVREACEALAGDLGPAGWEVRLKETLLTDREIGDSNMILLNGTPIEELLPDARAAESCCASCGDLLGVPVLCRTLERDGRTYEAIPASLIREAAHKFIQIHDT